MMPIDRALIRSALPNFVNFMRILHPGQAYAAKFDRSRAALGWDGSLLHCKSQGQVVPSFAHQAMHSAIQSCNQSPNAAIRQFAQPATKVSIGIDRSFDGFTAAKSTQ